MEKCIFQLFNENMYGKTLKLQNYSIELCWIIQLGHFCFGK